MKILFDKDYLKELYVTGKSNDKKHRYQPQIINKRDKPEYDSKQS